MSTNDSKFASVNLRDPRQDAHKVRAHDPNLNRYRVAEKLLPQSCTGLKTLELGGGIGELTSRMSDKGLEVVFVDISQSNVDKAVEAGFEAHCLDLNLGFPDLPSDSFDLVVMLEVIEHLVRVEDVLDEISRVTRTGGQLILSTPNFAFFQNRLRILRGHLSVDEGYHYRFFTKTVLKKRLEQAGFEIQQTHHTMPVFGLNLIHRLFFDGKRVHMRIPDPLASLFAQTLFVSATKK